MFISICLLCIFVTSITAYNYRLLLREYEDLEMRLAGNLATLNSVENNNLELQDALLFTSYELDTSLENARTLEEELLSANEIITLINPEEKIRMYLKGIWTAEEGYTDFRDQINTMHRTLDTLSPLMTDKNYKNHSATSSLIVLYDLTNKLGQDLIPTTIDLHLSSTRDNRFFYDYTLYFEDITDPDTQEKLSLDGSVMLIEENGQWLIDHDTFITTTITQLGAFKRRLG